MRMRALLLSLTLVMAPSAGRTQDVPSPPRVIDAGAPRNLAVTIYRNPDNDRGGINADWPRGFALISERRTVTLPAGRSRVRFTGVADSMIGVSAVVRGLPMGVTEQNRDAALLTPASLLDGSLGNRVIVRRTHRRTGVVTETEAIIRTGSDGAVVLQSADGLEGLRCSGLPETLVYPDLPTALADGPTFSVDTNAPVPTTAEVTLTYLASGFEWAADYVVQIDPVRQRLSLFAWATLANGNSVSFADAQLSLVAGTLAYSRTQNQAADAPSLNLRCHPLSDPRSWRPFDVPSPPPPPAAPAAEYENDIVVTAMRSRAVLADEQALGDLVLYRTPFNTSVAAGSQKQVALLSVANIPYRLLHTVEAWGSNSDTATTAMLRFANRRGTPLARTLPSGAIAVYQQAAGQFLPVGESAIPDTPSGRDVEFAIHQSEAVRVSLSEGQVPGGNGRDGRATIVNRSARTAEVEVRFTPDNYEGQALLTAAGRPLPRRVGYAYLAVRVPARGERVVRYRVQRQ
jgi:hypothetical protein